MTAQARMIDAIPVVTDATARDAWWPSATRTIGARVHRLDTNAIERWDGSAWVVDFTGAVASETWTAATLVNTWAAVGTFTPQYRLDRDGQVSLRGILQSGVANTAFTLPVGYRPTQQLEFAVAGFTINGGSFVATEVARVSISTAGVVAINVYGTIVAVSLAGITFSVS